MIIRLETHDRQTRFGIFSNLFDRADRETVGGWYISVHLWSLRLQVYSTRRRR